MGKELLMRKPSMWLIALCFLVAVGGAIAARNNSGSYSLPAGNPVVSGSTISSSWANSTLSDISTELTNSLDRYGRGAMLAPLLVPDGTASAPALSFSAEQGSGIYRAASNDIRLAVAGSDVAQWRASGATITGSLTCSAGATANQSTANGSGVTATGNGTGNGVYATGGASSGPGVYGVGGAPNGYGLKAQGTGTGDGLYAVGGSGGGNGATITAGGGGAGISVVGSSAAPAVSATGGTYGVNTTGSASGIGVSLQTASSATSQRDALTLTNGVINLDGVATPNSNLALKNRLTAKNFIKAWARIGCNSGVCTIADGYNVSGISSDSQLIHLTIAQAITSGAVTVTTSGGVNNITQVAASIVGGTDVQMAFWSNTGTGWNPTSAGFSMTINVIATGVQ